MKVDYIIVGQGIAGSMVAHYLLQQGKDILVIDKHEPNAASNIATGVVNPVTGRRMAKSWMIDRILPWAKNAYRELEEMLEASFFYETDNCKVFSSPEDVSIWKKKQQLNEYAPYLGEIVDSINENINAPYGCGIIKNGCWMDAPVFMSAYRNYLASKNLLREDTFEMAALRHDPVISYKEITAGAIIFCEGYRAYKNPYFGFIPFSIAKGEQFLIHAPRLKMDRIVNKNIFILPKGNDRYSAGSTFIWDDLEETVTAHGRQEIMEKLNRLLKCSYAIEEEKAGIRPTIHDRRPVIGPHPAKKNVYIFNGMGTKGVSLAPYFAHAFLAYLDGGDALPDEVSPRRFAYSNASLGPGNGI
jgi:glycine/D-amino acid oxidase-like deaminating enzyme